MLLGIIALAAVVFLLMHLDTVLYFVFCAFWVCVALVFGGVALGALGWLLGFGHHVVAVVSSVG